MKVLWFEVTEPANYSEKVIPIGGWQDSLEGIVSTISEIELGIAFMTEKEVAHKEINGVVYYPILNKITFKEKYLSKYWDIFVEKVLIQAKKIIDDFQPDIIHVFGTEYPFGQVQRITKIPVVIHIMGAIIPYNNAAYPPGYSRTESIINNWYNPKALFSLWKHMRDAKNREIWEYRTWKMIQFYMGRTNWDRAVSSILHPNCHYFHVDEAIRPVFFDKKKKWCGIKNKKLKLVSTGCGTFWKGPDMMIKVARILKDLDIDFEWNVAGLMQEKVKMIVERHEKMLFKTNNINILGFLGPEELSDLMINSSIYVHTAYIENSPNSICEAQILGIPVVSTNVGGISTLIEDRVDGILVPANDPWQMSYSIISLFNDKQLMQSFSDSSFNKAIERHNTSKIAEELLSAYHNVMDIKQIEEEGM